MSIYATLWTLRFPAGVEAFGEGDWVEVWAQAVPAHVGSPSPGQGYEHGDPYAAFLPPAIETDAHGGAPHPRAVVFVVAGSAKGTPRSAQEYVDPLLVLTGRAYAEMSFEALHRMLLEAVGARFEDDVDGG